MKMSSLSKSTIMMNCLVALSTMSINFQHPLYDEGFHLDMIEPRFILLPNSQGSSERKVAPDIQINKNNEYLLFFECKDGWATEDQLERYNLFTIDDIKRSRTTDLALDSFTFDLSYMGTGESEEKLIQSLGDSIAKFPTIIFNATQETIKIRFAKSSCKFRADKLNEIFQNLEISEACPTSFIPFTVDDKDDIILASILQYFTSRAGYEFTPYELLNQIFPYIGYYSQESRRDLIGRIDGLLKSMTKNEKLKEFLTFTNSKYKLDIDNKIRKFQRVCRKLIESYEKSSNQPRLKKYI